MKKEWENFVDNEKDYSMEEAVEKYNEMVEFMRSKKARLVSTPQCERQPLENEYHLTEDAAINDKAIETGYGDVMGIYRLNGHVIWIKTDLNECTRTTILLPEEW